MYNVFATLSASLFLVGSHFCTLGNSGFHLLKSVCFLQSFASFFNLGFLILFPNWNQYFVVKFLNSIIHRSNWFLYEKPTWVSCNLKYASNKILLSLDNFILETKNFLCRMRGIRCSLSLITSTYHHHSFMHSACKSYL